MHWRVTPRRPIGMVVAVIVGCVSFAGTASAATSGNFSYGVLQGSTVGASGCAANSAGAPAIHVSRANNGFLGSELGIGAGSVLWRGLGAIGGSAADACSLEYRGQPNAVVGGGGAAGGAIDLAVASAPNTSGNYNVYVASLNGGSVNVATSTDNGATFSQTPVQAGLPASDHEWIAAFGANTSLLTYHDPASNDIDVLRSDNGGLTYNQIAQVIPATDYKAANNQLGNIVIDHRNLPDTTGNFRAYQAFMAPSSSSVSRYDETFVGVSADGGHTWTDEPIPCSVSPDSGFPNTGQPVTNRLDQNFASVSVAPNGDLWAAWRAWPGYPAQLDAIFVAESSDHGQSWTCSQATGDGFAPSLVATSAGVDLAYYDVPYILRGGNRSTYVNLVQNTSGSASGPWTTAWGLYVGAIPSCNGSLTCTGYEGQLYTGFNRLGVDTDNSGWTHIAYTYVDPSSGSNSTEYAVQMAGAPVGSPNN